MRIWDINPGYLNRQSLLGEHRELHGIVSILQNNKAGYSRHPETLRWKGFGWALRKRHQLLACEMALRGYVDRSSVRTLSNNGVWPTTYIDWPVVQLGLLRDKYAHKEQGRIPLPKTAQQLWSQHKYSVLARDTDAYRELGRLVAAMGPLDDYSGVAAQLVALLRQPPSEGGIRNALQHMWGHVSSQYEGSKGEVVSWHTGKLLHEIQNLAMAGRDAYLTSSTALSELCAWIPRKPESPWHPGKNQAKCNR